MIHLEARFADHTESLGVYDTLDDALEAHPATPRGAEVVVSDMVPAPGFFYLQRRDPTDQERDQYPGINEVIEKAGLDEVSLVLRGAVPGAKVLALRSDTLDDALEAHPATPRGAEVVVSDMVPAPWYGDDVYYAGAALIRWKPT